MTLNYCVNLLKNKEPKPKHKKIMNDKEQKHTNRMNERIIHDIEELSHETFLKVFHELKQKEGNKYEFIIKGGESLLCALYNLFKTIWQTEEIPEIWRE